jgi:hypothetical protein
VKKHPTKGNASSDGSGGHVSKSSPQTGSSPKLSSKIKNPVEKQSPNPKNNMNQQITGFSMVKNQASVFSILTTSVHKSSDASLTQENNNNRKYNASVKLSSLDSSVKLTTLDSSTTVSLSPKQSKPSLNDQSTDFSQTNDINANTNSSNSCVNSTGSVKGRYPPPPKREKHVDT